MLAGHLRTYNSTAASIVEFALRPNDATLVVATYVEVFAEKFAERAPSADLRFATVEQAAAAVRAAYAGAPHAPRVRVFESETFGEAYPCRRTGEEARGPGHYRHADMLDRLYSAAKLVHAAYAELAAFELSAGVRHEWVLKMRPDLRLYAPVPLPPAADARVFTPACPCDDSPMGFTDRAFGPATSFPRLLAC